MSPTIEESLRAAVVPERLREDLKWFSGVPRDTGGPGERKAADYIAQQMLAAGILVYMHEFDTFLSYPIRAKLEVISPEPTQLRCVTHSFARATAPHGLTGSLCAVAAGDLARAAGQIALVDGLAAPVAVFAASQAGCTGIVFANEDRVIHNMIVTTIWGGAPTLDQVDKLPSIPVVSVNRQDGEKLKALLAQGQGVTLKLTTEVKTGWFPSRIPEVRIPGRQEPEKFVLVGAHYCAWHEGITDNATGDACLLEMARVLWTQREHLERSVRFCWWPGHSHGRYAGSTWYADTFFGDLASNCLAYHNIDSPGVKGATWHIARHTTAEVEDFCRDVIARLTGQADAPVNRPSLSADQSFLANGVPSFSTYPFLPENHPDRRPWTGGAANAWWWHTEFDTLDKADVEILAQDTRISLTAVAELANADVLPFRQTSVVKEIEGILTPLRAKVGVHVDLGPVADALGRYAAAVEDLESQRASAMGDPARGRIFNHAEMRLSRVLNPVIYSQGGRFAHDPAEVSPVMRATGKYVLTALNRAAQLPDLVGQPEYGYLRVQVLRERNRVAASLEDAIHLARTALAELA